MRLIALGLVTFGVAGSASAFTFESIVSDGCHERVTTEALALGGWPLEVDVPPADRDSASLAASVPFNAPPGSDLWTLSALIGVRYNDLGGASVLDFPELAVVHQGAVDQYAHCLRAPEDDLAEGDLTALAGCRAFILEAVEAALGDEEAVDGERTEEVPVALRFQEGTVALPAYPYHLGRALHALQDAFTHTLRSEDWTQVRHVFNYIDPAVSDLYEPAHDGTPHVSAFDACDPELALDVERTDVAARASAELLAALADDSGGRAGRLARAHAVLDAYLTHAPGCDEDNDFCAEETAALEAALLPPEGCAAAAPIFPAGLLGWALGRRRRRRSDRAELVEGPREEAPEEQAGEPANPAAPRQPRVPNGASRALLPLAVCGLLGATAAQGAPGVGSAMSQQAASADSAGASTRGASGLAPDEGETSALAGDDVSDEASDEVSGEATGSGRFFGVNVSAGGAIDRAGLNVSFGLRFRVSPRLILGADLEYAPWIDLQLGTLTEGVANAYLTGHYEWGTFGDATLRTSLQAGASRLLFDAYQTPRGSIGPFVALSLFNVAVRVHDRLWVELRPDIALSLPQIGRPGSVPLLYRQYRFTAGLHWELF